jgi:hypothetical protein
MESFVPYDHSDALYYHLSGPKIFHQFSWEILNLNLTTYVQAGYFDLIFYLPFFFFHSLLFIQLIGQFFHLFFSLILAGFYSTRRISDPLLKLALAISFLTIAKESSFFTYAKNDGVVALLGLIASIMVMEGKAFWQIGIALGLLVGTKMSGLMIGLPIGFTYLLFHYKDWKKVLALIGCVLLIAAPQLVKNYYYVGNPFFPGFMNLFPGSYSLGVKTAFSQFFGRPFIWSEALILLSDFFTGKVIFLVTPILAFLNVKYKNKKSNNYFYIALSILILYLVVNGGFRNVRYFFTCYFLLVYFIFETLDKNNFFKPLITKKWFLFVLMTIVLIDSKIDKSFKRVKVAFTDYSQLSEKEIILKHIHHANIWAQLPELPKGKVNYIISDYRSEGYYLPEGYFIHNPDNTNRASILFFCYGEKEIELLKTYHYAVLYTGNIDNLCFREIRSNWVKIYSHPEGVLYKNPIEDKI